MLAVIAVLLGVGSGVLTDHLFRSHYTTQRHEYALARHRAIRHNQLMRAQLAQAHAAFVSAIQQAGAHDLTKALADANATEQQIALDNQSSLESELQQSIMTAQNNLAKTNPFVQSVSSVSCIPTQTVSAQTQSATFNCIAVWSSSTNGTGTPYTGTIDFSTGAYQWQRG
jgi:hypothetical protein